MTKLAPEWVRTSDPVIRSPARYCWTTAPASVGDGTNPLSETIRMSNSSINLRYLYILMSMPRYRSPSWLARPPAGPLDRFRRLRDLVAAQRWIGLPTRRPTGLSRVHHRPHPGRLVCSGRGGQPAPARFSRSICISDPDMHC